MLRAMSTQPDTPEPVTVRLPLAVTRTDAQRIEAWRHVNRIGSRTEALRRLLRLGLEAKPASEATP